MIIKFTLSAFLISIVSIFAALSEVPIEYNDSDFVEMTKSLSRLDRDVLPTNVIPNSYDLSIKPDMDNFTFEGRVCIALDVKESTKIISMNAKELTIKNITMNMEGFSQTQQVKTFEIHQKEEILDIKLENELPTGSKVTLVIEFIGFINDDMAGFYRSSYDDSSTGSKKYMAATQFQATDARKAFPCWDEPAVKSKFNITVIIPKDLTALSNMDEEWRKDADDDKNVEIKFRETPAMSTYLVAWVIGDLDYIEETNENGILVRVYTTRGQAHQGKFALNVASRTLAFFTRYFDLPYPLPKMDLVAIPDFAAGAMENWGLITYRTTYLLFDDENSSLKTKQNVANVLGHELAHQWFGNLVTMEWWSDLWLNEGFATWVGLFVVDHLFPEWDIWTEFIYNDYQFGLLSDGLRSSHPIEVPVRNPSEIDQIFDSISYSKGASVIRMLTEYLGEETFQKGLRAYLSKHKYQNAKTSDLWSSLTEASGKPVEEIMTSWTKIIGFPVLTVEAERQADTINLKITQNRFFNGGIVKPDEDETIWSVPLGIITDSGVVEKAGLMTSRTATYEIPAASEYFKLNHKQTGFYRVHYPSEWLEKLGKAIESGRFNAGDRIGLVSDIFSLSIAGKLSVSEVLNVLRFFKNEDDYNVWSEINYRLNEVLSVWWEEDENLQQKLKSYIRNIFNHQVSVLGFEPKLGESDRISLLRPLVLRMAGKCGDQAVIMEARARFDRFISGDSSAIHPDLRGVVYSLIIRNGGQVEFDQVLDLYRTSTVPDQKIAALEALGASNQVAIITAALNLTTRHDGLVRPQDFMRIFRTAGENPAGRRLCWEFVQENWKLFHDLYYRGSTSVLDRMVLFSTREFTNNGEADAIERFFADKDVTHIDRNILQSLEKIRARSAWLDANKENITQWFANITA